MTNSKLQETRLSHITEPRVSREAASCGMRYEVSRSICSRPGR